MARYCGAKDDWRIWAKGLELCEATSVGGREQKPKRTSFKDGKRLIAAARKAMLAKRAKGRYRLDGNHQTGMGATTPRKLSPAIRRKLATVPRYIREDLPEILAAPDEFSGGLFFADGDLHVRGDWDASQYAAVLVTGNLTIDGLLVQLETEPIFIVFGDLSAARLMCTGRFFVGRDLRVTEVAYFEGDHGDAVIGRDAHFGTTILDALSLTVRGKLSTECVVARDEELLHVRPKPRSVIGLPDPRLRTLFVDLALQENGTTFRPFRDIEAMMLLGTPLRKESMPSLRRAPQGKTDPIKELRALVREARRSGIPASRELASGGLFFDDTSGLAAKANREYRSRFLEMKAVLDRELGPGQERAADSENLVATWSKGGTIVRLVLAHEDKEMPFVITLNVEHDSPLLTDVNLVGQCECSALAATKNPLLSVDLVFVKNNPAIKRMHIRLAETKVGGTTVRLYQCRGCKRLRQTGNVGAEYVFAVPPIDVEEWKHEPYMDYVAWKTYEAALASYVKNADRTPRKERCASPGCRAMAIRHSIHCFEHHTSGRPVPPPGRPLA